MKKLHFQANWVPVKKQFCVQVTADKHRFIEMMPEKRFFEFCDQLTEKIVVGGTTVTFKNDHDGLSRAQIRKYFWTVRMNYEEYKKKS